MHQFLQHTSDNVIPVTRGPVAHIEQGLVFRLVEVVHFLHPGVRDLLNRNGLAFKDGFPYPLDRFCQFIDGIDILKLVQNTILAVSRRVFQNQG